MDERKSKNLCYVPSFFVTIVLCVPSNYKISGGLYVEN